MRIGVARIPAHGFTQPVDRRGRVLIHPIGVSEVEEVIRLHGIALRRFGEPVRRPARLRLRRRGSLELHDAEVVQGFGATGFLGQRTQSVERIVEALQGQLGDTGTQSGLRRQRRSRRDGVCGGKCFFVLPLVGGTPATRRVAAGRRLALRRWLWRAARSACRVCPRPGP